MANNPSQVAQTKEGFDFVSTAVRRVDRWWDVPVDDEVALRIAMERLPAETDDDVVSRLVRTAVGKRPE
ncbi:MAG: hypothetical protein J0I48_04665 [Devosia sp.]|uniref:hypothetical protein n=1 Tax=Devosia sp. 66-22 TaxID=1895753 RepID=UPI000926F192|nr:hypothetical protein [Devosia sp. 66-22]MBN9345487.1 hypothetical protein [Devosia sp.]OJX47833.1 MAG: hypothetical protein BGO81_00250 [Devosia sp. 66-22]